MPSYGGREGGREGHPPQPNVGICGNLILLKIFGSYGPVRIREGVSTPTPKPKQFFLKRKRCRIVCNGKICILMKKFAKYVHLDLFYVLDYSGSFIKKIKKKIKKTKVRKNFSIRERGTQNVMDWSETFRCSGIIYIQTILDLLLYISKNYKTTKKFFFKSPQKTLVRGCVY